MGLSYDASEPAVLKQARSWRAQLSALAEATGLQASAEGAAVLQAVQTLRDPAHFVPTSLIVALQAELSKTRGAIALERAERCVDEAIRAGKVRAPARMRPHYIERHLSDPAAVELELGMMMPIHGGGGASAVPPDFAGGTNGLDADEAKIVALMGVDPKLYAQVRAGERDEDRL